MSRIAVAIVILSYVAVIAAALGGLHWARAVLLEKLETRMAHQEWEVWRDEAGQQAAGKGPVWRHVPPGAEPPTLVLLRDYYAICVMGVWLFTTLLFAVLVFVGRGIAVGRRDKPGGSQAGGVSANSSE